MNDEEIKDLLECIYGTDNVPSAVFDIVRSFRERKSKFRPQPVSVSEVAMITVVYDFMNSVTEDLNKAGKEDDEAEALKKLAEEMEDGE